MAKPRPAAVAAGERRVWSVGGGKGGIGKSLLAASIGWQLARSGQNVVLVDADLGGANLHNYLGLRAAKRTLGDFLEQRTASIEEALSETLLPGLRFVGGAAVRPPADSIGQLQTLRLFGQLRALDADVVLLDLGAGTLETALDLFFLSDVAILVVTPEPSSIEVGYRFVKSALLRRLRTAAPSAELRALVKSALEPGNGPGITTPAELIAWLEAGDADAAEVLRREVAALLPSIVVNGVRSDVEAAVGHQLAAALQRHLGVAATYAGFVHHDDAVWQAVRRHRPLMSDAPGSRAAGEIRELARRLARGEDLGHGY